MIITPITFGMIITPTDFFSPGIVINATMGFPPKHRSSRRKAVRLGLGVGEWLL
jgi:hypothetical protein